MSEFCEKKGIKRENSIARTPQQNSVAKRRNRTLLKAARTMLAYSKLPTTFWAESVNTACYVQNRVLVVKPHNKTPYELFRGRTPALSFMRQFGCHVTILNTFDHLGKFDGKSDDGFFVGYSLNSKAFRVYNIRTRKVEENLHIRFLDNKPIIEGNGPKWLFDIDVLTKSMNYVPVVTGTNSNNFVGTEESIGAGDSSKETGSSQDYILMPLWKDGSLFDYSSKNASNDEPQPSSDDGKKDDGGVSKESGIDDHERPENSTQNINTARPSINTANANDNTSSLNINTISPTVTTARLYGSQSKQDIFSLGDNTTLEATHAEFLGDEIKIYMSNITTTYPVPSVPTTRIHKDHPLDQVIGDLHSTPLTRRMAQQNLEELRFISAVYEGKTHKDLHTFLFACFLSQEEPKRIAKALSDPSWVEAMQEELLQFSYKKGHTQEEGIDYDEVFASIAGIEAIRLFLAYASFMGFMVYQIDVKSAFLYGRIEEEVYVCQPPGFEDPNYPNKVYKVVKALYGSHQAPRAWYETLAKYLLDNGIHRGKIDKTLFIKRKKGDILLVQVYVDDIIFGPTKKELSLRKFNITDVKTSSTLMDTEKALLKDSDGDDVDVHLYRSMTGSLMYLTSSRPDIMFAVCACARFQVTPKVSYLHAVNRIFRLISWQCKKQTVVATSTTEAEYVAAASCYRQVMERVSTTASSLEAEKFWATAKAKTVNGECQLQALVDKKKVIITETSIRRDLHLEDAEGTDCLLTATIFEELTRMSDSTNAVADEQVISMTAQDSEITQLKKRVKHLERRNKSKTPELKRLRKGRSIEDIDKDAEVTLVDETQERNDDLMFNIGDLDDEEVVVAKQSEKVIEEVVNAAAKEVTTTGITIPVSTAPTTFTTTTTNVIIPEEINLAQEITLAQALAAMKSVKPKEKVVIQGPVHGITTTAPTIRPEAKGIVIQEQEQATISIVPSQKSKDKGKAIMIEPEVPLKKKDQFKN
ncbi:putative ribonuclease H-like domain-containing protein [Tanacetum coccineum]